MHLKHNIMTREELVFIYFDVFREHVALCHRGRQLDTSFDFVVLLIKAALISVAFH